MQETWEQYNRSYHAAVGHPRAPPTTSELCAQLRYLITQH